MTSAPIVTHVEHPIYPTYCHRLSPTLQKWCPMLARDIIMLREIDGFKGQNLYFHLNHPIKYVKLTGMVVALDEFASGKNSGRIVITLDDGSGVNIECTCTAPPKTDLPLPTTPMQPCVSNHGNGTAIDINTAGAYDKEYKVKDVNETEWQSPDGPNLLGVEVGSVVKAKGGVGIFRGMKQVRLKRIDVLRETNTEVLAWREIAAFQKDVLDRLWTVGSDEEEQCRVEGMKEEIWKREDEEKRSRHRSIVRRTERVNNQRVKGSDMANERGGKYDSEKIIVRKRDLYPDNRVNYPAKGGLTRVAKKYN